MAKGSCGGGRPGRTGGGTSNEGRDVDAFIDKLMAERKAQQEKKQKSSFFNSNYIRSESPEAQRRRAYDEGHGGRGPPREETNFARRMRLMREGKI